MTNLTREDIEKVRGRLGNRGYVNEVCDLALKGLDYEQRLCDLGVNPEHVLPPTPQPERKEDWQPREVQDLEGAPCWKWPDGKITDVGTKYKPSPSPDVDGVIERLQVAIIDLLDQWHDGNRERKTDEILAIVEPELARMRDERDKWRAKALTKVG